jgi:hypothetical protein
MEAEAAAALVLALEETAGSSEPRSSSRWLAEARAEGRR